MPVVASFQVMAPLLDTNHELSWQANMVDVMEQKAANQRNEGPSVQPNAHTIFLLLAIMNAAVQ